LNLSPNLTFLLHLKKNRYLKNNKKDLKRVISHKKIALKNYK
jgi:hypothetical protein